MRPHARTKESGVITMRTFRLRMARYLLISLLLGAALLLPSCALGASSPAPTPTATIPVPTPTPNIALSAPRIVVAWLSPNQGPCEGLCRSVSFTTSGPFVVLISCDGFQQFSGSLPTVDFQIIDANGH